MSSASAARTCRDGFLWLATHDGLARFDGRRFVVFDRADQPALDTNRISGLYRDELGRLHALTSQGSLLKIRSNQIERILVDSDDPKARVVAVAEAPFCVTQATGLFCHDDAGEFERIAEFANKPVIVSAIRGLDNTTWLIGQQGQVYWQPDDRAARLIPASLPVALSDHARPFVLSDSSLVIPLLDSIVQQFPDGRTNTFQLPAQAHFNGEEIITVRRDQGLALWVGTSHSLYRLDTSEGRWTRPLIDLDEGQAAGWTLPDGSTWTSLVGTLFRDNEPVLHSDAVIEDVYASSADLVWISTLRDGIYLLSRPRVRVTDRRQGLMHDNLYGVALHQDGSLWLGSLDGEVQAIRPDAIQRYGTSEGLPGDNPWSVATAPDGSVYVATYHPGLFVLAPGSKRFSPVDRPKEMAAVALRALSFGPDGDLWVGGNGGVWQRSNRGWRRFCAGQLDQVRVLTIHHGSNGARWYGSSRGLWRELDGNCQAVAVDQLDDVEIRDLHEDDLGKLWASTQGHGLIRIDPDENGSGGAATMLRIGRRQGLPSNSLHAIAEDDAGNFWVNSNQGVFRLARRELEQFAAGSIGVLSPLVLTRADGLRELEGNGGVQPAAAVDQNGHIHFPSQSGLISIDARRLAIRNQAPPAIIDGLVAGGVAHSPHQDVRLQTGLRQVVIRFAAADLRGGPDRFRYRLQAIGRGTETSGWNEVIGQNSTSFAALAPGHYRFEVIAGNNDGVWGERPAVLAFSVPPYWYETGLFRWGSLIVVLLGLGWLAFYRMQYLQRQATVLNQEVELRTRELAQRNRKLAAQTDRLESLDRFRKRLLADVSHELRTPLMLIDLPLAELDDKAEQHPEHWDPSTRRSLKLARRQTGRLSELVSQLVTLVQAESGQLELKIRRFDLDGLIDELVQSYMPLAQQRDIELVSSRPEQGALVFADREQLTTALGNLLDNAIKHSEGGGRVELQRQIDDAESQVRIAVLDQGHGFDPTIASRLFERFFRDETGPKAGREGLGIGLALVREIIELHGGRVGAESRPGQGATFWIELPLGSSHIALADLVLDQPDPALIPAAETPADARQQRLALVEDHPELAAYLKERLMEFLPVTLFTSAEQALAEIDRQSFGMLLSDVVLPGQSGVDLCRQVRQQPHLADLPVILVSAKAGAGDREAALAAGADDYLVKPFSLDELLAAIGKVWPAVQPLLEGSPMSTGDPLMTAALDHLTDPAFGVDDWARAVHLSPRQLRRRVAEICGQSPLVWLREQRLLRVRQLISSGQCKTLAEAGACSGLDNPAYLYRLYRARFGENSEQ